MSAPCIIYHKTGLIIWQILAAMHIWMVSHWTAAFGSVWHEHRTEPQCIHCGNNYMWARACESNRQTHISIECKCHKPIDRMFRIRSLLLHVGRIEFHTTITCMPASGCVLNQITSNVMTCRLQQLIMQIYRSIEDIGYIYLLLEIRRFRLLLLFSNKVFPYSHSLLTIL